tara:strand:+ start:41 stop:862 length:822 start_codon:yes stop_codon:yes gene_type:complete
MKREKQFLNEIAMKMGKVYTAKDNPPFKVNELNKLVPNPDGTNSLIPVEKSKLVPQTDFVSVLKKNNNEVDKFYQQLGGTLGATMGQGLRADTSPLSQISKGNKFSNVDNEPAEKRETDVLDTTAYDKNTTDSSTYTDDKKDTKTDTKTDNKTDDKKSGGMSPFAKGALGLGAAYGAYKTLQAIKKRRDKKRRQDDSYNPSGALLSEGPSYEYRKHTNKISKSMKQHQASVLDFYEMLRKKGLDKEATMLLDAYKKNLVTFKKTYDKIMRKLV